MYMMNYQMFAYKVKHLAHYTIKFKIHLMFVLVNAMEYYN